MTTSELNSIIANARNNYKNGVKSPIKLMNIMNGQAFKNDPALKAALKALDATKWSLDLAPHTLTGAVCKVGKAVPEDYIFDDDKALTFIAGKLYFATVIDSFKGEDFLTICKQKKALVIKAEEKAQKAADKEAKKAQAKEDRKKKAADKKAQKAADKKTSDRRDAIEDMYEMGLINDDQREAMLQALTVEKAA